MWLQLLTDWNFDPTILLGLAALAVVFALYEFRPRRLAIDEPPQLTGASLSIKKVFGDTASGNPGRSGRVSRFALMLVVALIALTSPLDMLSDHELFSAHMLQHLLLVLGVAPLLVSSVPPELARAVRAQAPAWLLRLAGNPAAALVLFSGVLLGWHVPFLYQAALLSEPIHAVEHLSFVATACPFWWLALAPLEQSPRLSPLARIAYIFVGAIPNTLLGIVLTFSPTLLYPIYSRLNGTGIGEIARQQLGLSPLADQQAGGLMMWAGGSAFYLLMILSQFIGWSSSVDTEEEEEERRQAPIKASSPGQSKAYDPVGNIQDPARRSHAGPAHSASGSGGTQAARQTETRGRQMQPATLSRMAAPALEGSAIGSRPQQASTKRVFLADDIVARAELLQRKSQ